MNLFFVTAALILLICSVMTYFYSFRLSGLPGPRLKVFLLYAVITAASAVAVRLFQAENLIIWPAEPCSNSALPCLPCFMH